MLRPDHTIGHVPGPTVNASFDALGSLAAKFGIRSVIAGGRWASRRWWAAPRAAS